MQNTDWIQIRMRTGNKLADTAAELLEQLGAIAVSYTDAEDSPILEPKPGERRLWPATEVTGLLPQGTDPEPILFKLKAILGDHLPMMSTRLEDKNWIRAWMDQFKPLKFGKHLWICPSWLKVEEEDAIVVMLDPGLAFGTGTHPTTSLCLGFLDSLDLKDKEILDYGCGSGILAIAGLKLGAKKALGVDIDELILSQPDSGEQALEIAEMLVRSGVIDLIVIDSVAALVPQVELDGEMGDAAVGLQARLMSKALRKLSGVMNKTNCTVIFINQLREKIGVMYGNPETTTGGRALKFYSSVRVEIRRSEQIKQNGEIIGNKANIKVVKNKVAPPFKTTQVDIIYGKGISRDGEILDLAVEGDIVEKSGAWYAYNGEKIGQGRENAKNFLIEHPAIFEEVEEKVKAQLFGTEEVAEAAE